MKIKKLIAVCLTIVMVCTMMCIPAFASSGTSQYEVDKNSYFVNESLVPGSEVFLNLRIYYTVDGIKVEKYFDIPVDIAYPEQGNDDWKDYNTFLTAIFDSGLTSFDLGYFDFSSQGPSDFGCSACLYASYPSGTYQLSASYPIMGARFSMGSVTSNNVYVRSLSPMTHGSPNVLGSTVGSYFGPGESVSVFDVPATEDVYFSCGGDLYDGIASLAGSAGNLVVELTPFYMYFGEPLEDGAIFPPPAPIKDFMGNVSTIFHNVINWVALTAETIVSNPLILIFSIVPYIGLGISIYARIKRTKK